MESEKNSAMGKATEVRSLEYYQRGLEVCQRELETYKTLYWGLQLELDGIDTIRKSNPYIALRRYNAMEKHIAEYKCTHSDKEEEARSISEPDVGYDCVGGTTITADSELKLYKKPYWELQDGLDKIEFMRKNSIRYAALRRQKTLENLGLIFENNQWGPKKLKINIKNGESCNDWDCDGGDNDCSGRDEID